MTRPLPVDLRERLFRVALSHFREQGYSGTSISQVTLEAGVAKGTFFNYFPTKDHVLSEVLRRWMDEAMAEAGERFAGTEAVLVFARALASRVSSDRKVGEALVIRMSEMPGVPISERGGAVRGEDRIRDWIEARLTEALPVAVPLVEVRPNLLAFVLGCVLRGTLDEWVRGRREGEALDLAMADRINYVLEAYGLPMSSVAEPA